jgi:lipopolysaccharide/colanic/teichoic acid biosynthesis glycosyltransferase
MRSAPLSARNFPSVKKPPHHVVPSVPMPWGKRALDITFALLALPVLLVATLIMTFAMAIVSPGPVFFYQERIGYLGRRFRCYKFRTMFVGADTTVHRAYCEKLISSNSPWSKLDQAGDSRLIPGGRLIRASGLDELPQLINILRGEMSLIGPRPCLPYEYEKYLPWQRERFATLPGLTGLWQVCGKNMTTFDEMIRLDIHYAQNKSWWLDVKIFFRTFPTLARQIGQSALRKTQGKPVRPAPGFAAVGVSMNSR